MPTVERQRACRSTHRPPFRSQTTFDVACAPARHGEELRELVQLCTGGRIYEVERWTPASALGRLRL